VGDAPLAGLAVISEALAQSVDDWLAHAQAIKGTSANTAKAYRADVTGFLAFMANHFASAQGTGAIARLTVGDMRSWMAHERARGVLGQRAGELGLKPRRAGG